MADLFEEPYTDGWQALDKQTPAVPAAPVAPTTVAATPVASAEPAVDPEDVLVADVKAEPKRIKFKDEETGEEHEVEESVVPDQLSRLTRAEKRALAAAQHMAKADEAMTELYAALRDDDLTLETLAEIGVNTEELTKRIIRSALDSTSLSDEQKADRQRMQAMLREKAKEKITKSRSFRPTLEAGLKAEFAAAGVGTPTQRDINEAIVEIQESVRGGKFADAKDAVASVLQSRQGYAKSAVLTAKTASDARKAIGDKAWNHMRELMVAEALAKRSDQTKKAEPVKAAAATPPKAKVSGFARLRSRDDMFE